MTHHHLTLASPVGEILLTAEDDGLTGLFLAAEQRAPEPGSAEGGPFLEDVRDQLEGYFAGGRRAFDVALAPAGTAWQRRVWDELGRIPFGETITYAELARRAANGQNPISIVIPCHRVVGSDGRLTGYSGGLDAKRWLLDHEGVAR